MVRLQLDLLILKVFSNLSDSMILRNKVVKRLISIITLHNILPEENHEGMIFFFFNSN